jgi:signal transduction histidine kinase
VTRRLGILVDHVRNRDLLETWVAGEAELERAGELESADLVLVDGPALKRERNALRWLRRQVAPAYLPVVLLTPHRRVTMLTSDLWRDLDDVVTTPIRTGELRVRVERLLRIRETSLSAARGLDELRRSNADLQEFAYVAAHELVAPLAIVSGVLDTVSLRFGDAGGPTVEMLLDEGRRGAARLQHLIDDLLAYSRAGRETPLEPVELDAVVPQALEVLAPQIAESHARVEIWPMPAVLGDASQLRLVFSNLVGNAVKYRADGRTPLVQVSAAERDGHVVVSIADNGIGVDAHRAEAIFEMFERERRGMAQPGSGIGLALCRRIVERHGGRIWVDPGPECGSVFRFTLRRTG